MGHRLGSDLVWLWLWCRPAATAQIGPLAWELPYAVGVALGSKKKKKKEKKEKEEKEKKKEEEKKKRHQRASCPLSAR